MNNNSIKNVICRNNYIIKLIAFKIELKCAYYWNTKLLFLLKIYHEVHIGLKINTLDKANKMLIY